ncbi:MAG: NUDIX hydrolase [Candidatus Accumulibacter sp.]|jgi:ADP-ribose pyrophosphatase YjhB (NUDIX family)|uniref:NUDIX hydrolase n=1 Tax=Accumulibacter sp. TaxID=2053492 RepID=UPI001A4233E0|nr:NUDIX hydrolase [Accumulibacter sp.]MBL8395199.1 NUDIX hydrolase [Accumulibacter sp.]
MNFCSQCGGPVQLAIPAGDSLPRHVCQHCGSIHYLNPKLVVGCIAEWQDRILLCRRSIAPRYGRWTLPAGFMENGETTSQAAIRETLEEACARVDIRQLFSLVNVPHINQVHLFYRAQLLDPDFSAGLETLEAELFAEDSLPWKSLAFQSVTLSLQAYFSDRKAGHFGFHEETIQRDQRLASDLHQV